MVQEVTTIRVPALFPSFVSGEPGRLLRSVNMSGHAGDRPPKLYRELASWFHLLTAPEEYAEEAERYRRLITEGSERPPETVLELGSGGGNNASHMKAHFDLTLVDRSPEMLDVSRALNPEPDLRAVIETAFEHCRVGGVALFVPLDVRERFQPRTGHGGHDGEARSLRYLEWVWDPDPADTTYLADFAYLLRDETGAVRAEHDRHVCGLFARSTWLRLLEEVGFRPDVRTTEYGEEGGGELFVARKRPSSSR